MGIGRAARRPGFGATRIQTGDKRAAPIALIGRSRIDYKFATMIAKAGGQHQLVPTSEHTMNMLSQIAWVDFLAIAAAILLGVMVVAAESVNLHAYHRHFAVGILMLAGCFGMP